jgi:peptide/nickel transport system substrate-binding protein
VLNNLEAVGIRATLRPFERAAFFKSYAEKSYKNIIQGGCGAFSNAATRLQAFVVKGGMYEQECELDLKQRQTALHEMQKLVHDRTICAPLWQLAFLNGGRAACREIGPRP